MYLLGYKQMNGVRRLKMKKQGEGKKQHVANGSFIHRMRRKFEKNVVIKGKLASEPASSFKAE